MGKPVPLEDALAALRAAAWRTNPDPEYVPAVAGSPLYLHRCGHVEALDEQPDDGGCDACESGSGDPGDWRPLYVDNTPPAGQRIHVFAGIVGAEWDLAEAERYLRQADKIEWMVNFTCHDLTARRGDEVRHFDVPAPFREARRG